MVKPVASQGYGTKVIVRGSLVVRLSFLSVIAVTVEQGFPVPLHSY